MAVVKISQAHTLSLEEATKRLRDAFSAVPSKSGVKHHWAGDKLVLKGSGFEADVRVTSTSVDVEAKLGIAASIFKGQIESGIRTELGKLLKA